MLEDLEEREEREETGEGGDEGRRPLEDSGGGTLRAAMLLLLLLLLLPLPPPLIILKSAATIYLPIKHFPRDRHKSFPRLTTIIIASRMGSTCSRLPLPMAQSPAVRDDFEQLSSASVV